ncbi:hypothetical protein B0H13DRAFT_1705265 [Mycena leptocephala]|nr:hypothetical protein B0H13DRAFT_1705265 [Mycena leptocephala]
MILVLNITGAASPAAQMLPQTQLSITVVIAQGLLYFSLFSTLLAALLAVLGKQWLLHYDSVGQKGTVDQRGLERQRKFDGLRRWKFHIIMQIFPLLLQFSLLLFATALSIYLWTIHRGIAGIVLGSTCLGLILYTLMVVSAVVSPDSPFQTSLTTLLGVVVKLAPLPSLAVVTRAFFDPLHRLVSRIWSASWNFMKTIPPPLPQFALRKIPEATVTPQPSLVFPQIPQPSEQVSAVVWALV